MSSFTKSNLSREPIYSVHIKQNLSTSIYSISELINHRAPFVFIDRILGFDRLDRTLLTTHLVKENAFWVQGHFPEEPIFPGVLLIEQMAQTALCLLRLLDGDKPCNPRLLNVDKVEFLHTVKPGDRTDIVVKLIDEGLIFSCHGQVFRGEQLVCQGLLMVLE